MYQTARTDQTVSQGYEVVYLNHRTEHYTEADHTQATKPEVVKVITLSVAFYHLYVCLSKIFASF